MGNAMRFLSKDYGSSAQAHEEALRLVEALEAAGYDAYVWELPGKHAAYGFEVKTVGQVAEFTSIVQGTKVA